ncbi:MAG: insulinase family protein, partial [Elusimicrobia bacterium]|nr:insulinase family protein [Elusimicrobiota bacterium]
PYPLSPNIIFVDRPGSEQSQITVGYSSILRTDPDYYSLAVANGILGVVFTSRLNKNLREQKGYTYGASSRLQFLAKAGIFSAGAAVPTAVTAPALRELLSEIDRMKQDEISDEELMETKNYLQGADAISQASQEYLTGKLLSLALFNLPLSELYLYRERIASVTKDEAADVSRRRFSSKRARVVIVGDAQKIVPSLESLGQIIVYDTQGKTQLKPAFAVS